MLFTHPLGLLMLGTLGLASALDVRGFLGSWKAWLAVHLGVLIVTAPWLRFYFDHAPEFLSGRLPIKFLLATPIGFLGGDSRVYVAILALIAFGLYRHRITDWPTGEWVAPACLALWLVLPPTILYAYSWIANPIFGPARYTLFCAGVSGARGASPGADSAVEPVDAGLGYHVPGGFHDGPHSLRSRFESGLALARARHRVAKKTEAPMASHGHVRLGGRAAHRGRNSSLLPRASLPGRSLRRARTEGTYGTPTQQSLLDRRRPTSTWGIPDAPGEAGALCYGRAGLPGGETTGLSA